MFYQLTKKFKEENLSFNALDSYESIFPEARVLLTTQEDLDKYHPDLPGNLNVLKVNLNQSLDEILLLTNQYLKYIYKFHNLIVAIDPGSSTSAIAIFLDDNFVYSRDFYDIDNLINFIQNTFSTYPNRQKIIKLGNGNRRITRYFLNKLLCNQMSKYNIQYYLVDEHGSSKFKWKRASGFHSVHEKAALIIGRRKGILLTSDNLL